jgi:hypothetical protein
MPIDKSFLSLVYDHLNRMDAEGAGGDPDITKTTGPAHHKTVLDDRADIGDSLANIITKGYKGFTDDDIRADYGRITQILGKEKAQNLIEHAFEFNNRNDVQGRGAADRLNRFYSTDSGNKDTDQIKSELKTFAEGPLSRLNQSSNLGNQKAAGTEVASAGPGTITKDQFQVIKDAAPK